MAISQSKTAATLLIKKIAAWENTEFPIATELERWEEPAMADSIPGDFHLLDQPTSFATRAYQARPIRHHRPG